MNRIATATLVVAGLAATGLGSATAQATTLAATPVTTANLPTTAQLVQGPREHYVVGSTATNTTTTASSCQAKALKAYAPNRVITRTYDGGAHAAAKAQVASFASHARAVAVADQLGRALKGCAARDVKANPDLLTTFTEYYRTVKLPTGQLMYLQTMNMTDGETSTHFIVENGVVATGTHVEVLMVAHGGTNGSMDTRAIQRTLAGTIGTLAR